MISEVVFTRSSSFILELLQNAEDAGLGLESLGVFQVMISKNRIKIIHNGAPFTEENIRALCGIRSSKRPERGTLGYLGIGFKTVFKITDSPEIYSSGFQFKFDKNHKEWRNSGKIPWQVIPIWIDQPSETVDHEKTTFILHFRQGEYYDALRQELSKMSTGLFLFLHWLKRIEIIDEVSGRTSILENLGENKDGVTTIRHDGQEQKFKFFSRVCLVPEWVKQDRRTQTLRANVTQREILVAFELDKENNLAPTQAGAMYGGVYSFLPLGEERSGAKFPIQADFLVQPGREAIHYEIKWNQWLVEQLAEVCKEAINHFKNHKRWKNHVLPIFDFTKSKGLDAYDKLFGPKLIEPVENFLQNDECVPTADGGWCKPGEAVKIDEDQKAIDDLVNMDILSKDELAPVLGEQSNLRVVAPDVKEPNSRPFKKVDRLNLLKNKAFLEEKSKSPDATDWFRKLYLWLEAHPRSSCDKKDHRSPEGYWSFRFVLTANGELYEGGKVFLPDFWPSESILKTVTEELQKSRKMIHPDILGKAKDEKEQQTIKGFLTSKTGVQLLDGKTVCKEALLPKISTISPKPNKENLLLYTIHCQQILGEDVERNSEFWILTKDGEIRAAKEVFFPKEFKPVIDWETHQQYVPGLNFISLKYIDTVTDDNQLTAWRQFFKNGGVKDKPCEGVEVFGRNYAMKKLEKDYRNVRLVDNMKFGYDLEMETCAGETLRTEVKGQSHDQDVELANNEAEKADQYKDAYYLCVVSGIPENPVLYLVKNPAKLGKKEKITIPVSLWKTSKWSATHNS